MQLELLKKKNYLAMIRNSAKGENNMFRNVFALMDGQEKDIVGNGDLSCALFVSAILYINKLIGDIHTTVSGTEKDLIKSGWQAAQEMKEGAVLIWEHKDFDDGVHSHIGFYVGDNKAVSNGSKENGVPIEHDVTYNGQRKVEKIYWHSSLD